MRIINPSNTNLRQMYIFNSGTHPLRNAIYETRTEIISSRHKKYLLFSNENLNYHIKLFQKSILKRKREAIYNSGDILEQNLTLILLYTHTHIYNNIFVLIFIFYMCVLFLLYIFYIVQKKYNESIILQISRMNCFRANNK